MGKTFKIKILDSVHCQADSQARQLILPCLTVSTETRIRTEEGLRPGVKQEYLISGFKNTSGLFFTGLLPRVKKYIKAKKLPIVIKGREEKIKPKQKMPVLTGIKFWTPQLKAIKKACRKGRGQIVLPTGSGKTVIALGLFFCFSSCVRLFLCHTKDLYYQTIEELKKYKFKNVIEIKTNTNWNEVKKVKNPILISLVQSFAKIDIDNYIDFLDMIIVDEVHHVNSERSQYGKILQSTLAPLRFGLTATPDPNTKKAMLSEGLLGPVIYRLTTEEGVKNGMIAKPKINLEVVPYDVEINKICAFKYKNFYDYGIINNLYRNKKIIEIARKCYNEKGASLILIERTEHGEVLQKLFLKAGIKVPFVFGKTSSVERAKVKEDLLSGKIRIAIASRIWKEGLNIPNLTSVINAHGYKDEKGVIQVLGRGLRRTKTKKEIVLTDFLDPYKYLAEHTVSRIQTYRREGWI